LNLLALLANIKVSRVGDDRMIWPHDSKGEFTIKSFYRVLCEGSCDIDFPVDVIWRSKAPIKACFFGSGSYKGKNAY